MVLLESGEINDITSYSYNLSIDPQVSKEHNIKKPLIKQVNMEEGVFL